MLLRIHHFIIVPLTLITFNIYFVNIVCLAVSISFMA
jgi:hypothetical protein